MRLKRDIWFLILTGGIFLLVISLPYIFANQTSSDEFAFGGFLFNPIDGNSYLAKMNQGSLGGWKFRFLYTAEAGEGGYIFLYYLGLGKLAALFGLSNIFTFHAARLLGSLLMLIALWNFYSKTMISHRSHRIAFLISLIASGLGWLAALFGGFTADFWVAEGYPFLSAYANPHFPLGMGIMLFLLTPTKIAAGRSRLWLSVRTCLGSILLALILPFGIVICGLIFAAQGIWEMLARNDDERAAPGKEKGSANKLRTSPSTQTLIWLLIGGLPVLIYDVWLTYNDPVFSSWNSQNLTASPPFWDLFISYAPLIVLALPGGYLAIQEKKPSTRVLILWAIISAVLIYVPWGLQRRFLLGYAIPLAGLASIAIEALLTQSKMKGIAAVTIFILLVVPTNLIVLMGGLQAITSKDERIFFTQDELQSLDWLASHTSPDSLILAGPEMGLYIPAVSGRRVFYGHPFETANAEHMETVVTQFFEGKSGLEVFSDADYIYYSSREQALGRLVVDPAHHQVYSSNSIKIFQIDQNLSDPGEDFDD